MTGYLSKAVSHVRRMQNAPRENYSLSRVSK